MFRCQLCQSVVPAGTRSTKVVLVTREKIYGERGGGGHAAARGGFRKRGGGGRRNSTPKKDYDKGGQGTEIVREAMACPRCAEDHQRQLDQETAAAAAAAEAALVMTTENAE